MTKEQLDKIKKALLDRDGLCHEPSISFTSYYILSHPTDFNLISTDTLKEPALLVNGLTPEQLIALRNAINEAAGDKLFGREEVVRMLADYEHPSWRYTNEDDSRRASEWLDNHLKK